MKKICVSEGWLFPESDMNYPIGATPMLYQHDDTLNCDIVESNCDLKDEI